MNNYFVRGLFFIFLSFIVFTSCNNQNIQPDIAENAEVVSTSGDIPDWYITTPEIDDEYAYFIGYDYGAANIQDGKDNAMMDASYKAISYIGINVNVERYQEQEFTTVDDVESYIEEVYSYVGASGSADVEMKIIDTYFEKYSDKSVDIAILVGCSVESIKEARETIEFLAQQQRENAETSLVKADEYLDKGLVTSALEETYNALFMAEKASENADLYEEAQIKLYNILSSLSLSLSNSPRYAYIEGGSDDIIVTVNSTYSSDPIGGVMLSAEDVKAKSKISTSSGYVSDTENGQVIFNVSELFDYDETAILTGDEDPIELLITYSLEEFYDLEEVNSEYYEKIKTLLNSLALEIELDIASEELVTPTGVVVVKTLSENSTYSDISIRDEMQTSIGEIWADLGFSLYTINVPQTAVSSGKNKDNIKESVIRYLKNNYSDLKRVLYVLEVVNDLGPSPVKATLRSGEVNLYISLINLENEEVTTTITLMDRSIGINLDQAVENIEEELLESLEEELASF